MRKSMMEECKNKKHNPVQWDSHIVLFYVYYCSLYIARIKSRLRTLGSQLGSKSNVIRLECVCSVRSIISWGCDGWIMCRPIKNARRLDGCKRICVSHRTWFCLLSSIVSMERRQIVRFTYLIQNHYQVQTFSCMEPVEASGIEMSHLKALVYPPLYICI